MFLVLDHSHFCSELYRMILKYLIPVKLSIGILPEDWLLEKYNLVEVCHTISLCFLYLRPMML